MRLRRTVRFRASGERLPAFMNAVRHSLAVCTEQRCISGEYSGRIYYSDLEIIEKLAEETGVSILADPYEDTMYRIYRYRTRYGIILGVMFAAFFVFFMSSFITRIEINGCDRIKEDEILGVLEECGISHGRFIPGIDFTSAELILEERINTVSWSAIRSRGGKVIVDISEDDGRSGSVQSELPCNIVSDHDAVIISAMPYRGQCMVKKGDAVARGDILISGILTNEKYNYLSAHAEGEIIGEYKETQAFVRYFENAEKIYGETKYRKLIDFFGFRIPLGLSLSGGNLYDKSEHNEMFEIHGHSLPIGIITEKYDFYTENTKTETEDEACRNAELQIMLYEKNFLSDKKVTDRKLEKQIFEDRVEYSTEYTLQGKIGQEKMLFPGKTEEEQ